MHGTKFSDHEKCPCSRAVSAKDFGLQGWWVSPMGARFFQNIYSPSLHWTCHNHSHYFPDITEIVLKRTKHWQVIWQWWLHIWWVTSTINWIQYDCKYWNEPSRDKTNKMTAPSEDSDQPRHPPSLISSVSAWRKLGSLATHWAHSENWSDWADGQADLRLLGARAILLVLSWDGSNTEM